MDQKSAAISLVANLLATACIFSPSGSVKESESGTTDVSNATTEPGPHGSTTTSATGFTSTTPTTGAAMSGTSTTEASTTETSMADTSAATVSSGTIGPDSTTDVPAFCGDGVVDPELGEQCDAGAMNGDGQACTAECLNNVCGDSNKGPGEGCDDGNNLPGDGCSLECVLESCGDGVVQPDEQCDDGNMTNNDKCTDQCTLPFCGDNIVQVGELCDDGSESATCNDNCTKALCGDGNLNKTAGEACDDGNMATTDGCVACQPAKCGDGFIQAGVEECDDTNLVPGDGCSASCKLETRRVFVSSIKYNGNMGGVEGADLRCATLALNAQLGGQWMAWISEIPDVSPSVRFKKSNAPYVLINGKVVADNWADLTDGSLKSAITLTETGVVSATQVWTSTTANGSIKGTEDCNGWLSTNAKGVQGSSGSIISTWSDLLLSSCGNFAALYCVEQ